MLILNTGGTAAVPIARRRAMYFAGSQYITWLSWSEVLMNSAGYGRASRLV